MTDPQAEALIKEHGADVAPRVTREQIEAVIVSEHYFTAREGLVGALVGALVARGVPAAACETANVVPQPPQALGLVTFCVLLLRNGHRIVGVNEGPVSAENFDPEVGRKFAREDAIDKVWPLEGYLLKQMLHVASIEGAAP